MLDFSTLLVGKLKEILPTDYELFLDSKTKLPCITYSQIVNSDLAVSNNSGWSTHTFRIKVWAKTVKELSEYSAIIDEKLAEIGHFKRQSSNDLVYGSDLCRVLDYSITVEEKFIIQRYL